MLMLVALYGRHHRTVHRTQENLLFMNTELARNQLTNEAMVAIRNGSIVGGRSGTADNRRR